MGLGENGEAKSIEQEMIEIYQDKGLTTKEAKTMFELLAKMNKEEVTDKEKDIYGALLRKTLENQSVKPIAIPNTIQNTVSSADDILNMSTEERLIQMYQNKGLTPKEAKNMFELNAKRNKKEATNEERNIYGTLLNKTLENS